jgi:hypothetical protein
MSVAKQRVHSATAPAPPSIVARAYHARAPRAIACSCATGRPRWSGPAGRRHGQTAATRRSGSRFIDRASPRQLALFGFPPPGHPYWTPHTLAGMAMRYPNLDLASWRAAMA